MYTRQKFIEIEITAIIFFLKILQKIIFMYIGSRIWLMIELKFYVLYNVAVMMMAIAMINKLTICKGY